MAKKVSGYIKLQVPAGKANPAPPIGPALGQHGIEGRIHNVRYGFDARLVHDRRAEETLKGIHFPIVQRPRPRSMEVPLGLHPSCALLDEPGEQ